MTLRSLFVPLLTLSLLLAGCLQAPEDLDAATGAPALDAPEALAPVDVAFDGHLGMGVYACAPVTCVSSFPMFPDRFSTYDLQGSVDVALRAEWDATSELSDTLVLGVFACHAQCGNDAEISSFDYVSGGSPLTLDVEGFDVPEDEVLWVYMNVHAFTGFPGYTALYTPQEFHVAGTLTPRAG